MKTKPKLMVCALIFVSGANLNLFFSTAVHGLLTREITRLSLLPIGDCLASLFSNRQHMMLYLCLQGFVSVLAVMFFLTNMRPYESDPVSYTHLDVYKRQGYDGKADLHAIEGSAFLHRKDLSVSGRGSGNQRLGKGRKLAGIRF